MTLQFLLYELALYVAQLLIVLLDGDPTPLRLQVLDLLLQVSVSLEQCVVRDFEALHSRL